MTREQWLGGGRLQDQLIRNQVRIILEGTHSTGKSTLLKNLQRCFPALPVIGEPVRPVFARHGIDARYLGKSEHEIALIQDEIMQAHCAALEAHKDTAALVDRAPVSVAAYSLARLSRTTDPDVRAMLDLFTCQANYYGEVPNDFYLVVPPNIDCEQDGVREDMPCYRQQIHFIIRGILANGSYIWKELVHNTPEERVVESLAIISEWMHEHF